MRRAKTETYGNVIGISWTLGFSLESPLREPRQRMTRDCGSYVRATCKSLIDGGFVCLRATVSPRLAVVFMSFQPFVMCFIIVWGLPLLSATDENGSRSSIIQWSHYTCSKRLFDEVRFWSVGKLWNWFGMSSIVRTGRSFVHSWKNEDEGRILLLACFLHKKAQVSSNFKLNLFIPKFVDFVLLYLNKLFTTAMTEFINRTVAGNASDNMGKGSFL